MTNIIDYVKWRGDLSFEQDPFNAIDALLFASVSYVDFTGIVPEDGEISLTEATDLYYQLHSKEELDADKTFYRFSHSLLKAASQVKRYQNLTFSNYVDHTDPASLIQFSVITVRISPEEVFIAFRGTDDAIVGWKEDFFLSYMRVSSEEEALDYLTRLEAGKHDKIMMGGHSKGGHLAIHAAIYSAPEIQDRITGIFDFDGPGFSDKVTETEEFGRIGHTIHRFIPENSIIGRLLSDTAVPTIVYSSEKGIMQHDPMSWGIEGKEFVTMEKTSINSDVFDDTLTAWLAEMTEDQLEQFINDLFAVLEASGETRMTNIPQVNLFAVKKMLDKMHSLKRDSQLVIRKLIRLFIDNWGEVLIDYRRTQREELTAPLRNLLEGRKA